MTYACLAGCLASTAAGSVDFTATWKTNNTSSGSSSNNQAKLPLVSGGTYDFIADWGDGNTDHITAFNQAAVTHTYAAIGTYIIKITGTCTGFRFNNTGDRLKILIISRWGTLRLGNAGQYFRGCTNLTITATDVLDLTGTTTFLQIFLGCSSLTTIPSANSWDTAAITSMTSAFTSCTLFNQNIGSWNTAAVTDMTNLFQNCTAFNQNIGSWNTSSVTSFQSIFSGCTAFNQNIGSWNTAAVTTMANAFQNCTAFNQNIGSWNTSSVTSMNTMFFGCTLFNQNIGSWNTAAVTDMGSMLRSCPAFNQNISSWNTAAVTTMSVMFASSTSFDQNLGAWNITSVTSATSMFLSVTLSTANYNGLLAGWGAQIARNNVTFSGGNSHYDATTGGFNGTAGRLVLTAIYTWTITDGGTP